jgi:hypothetical protein
LSFAGDISGVPKTNDDPLPPMINGQTSREPGRKKSRWPGHLACENFAAGYA